MTKLLIVGENPFGKSSFSHQSFDLINEVLIHNDVSYLEINYFCVDIGLSFQKESITYDKLPFHDNYKVTDEFKKIRFYTIYEKVNFWKKIYLLCNLNNVDKVLVIADLSEFDTYNCGNIKAKKYLYLPVKDSFDINHLETYENNVNPNKHILSHLPIFDKIATPSEFGRLLLNKRYDYDVDTILPIINHNDFSDKYDSDTVREEFNIDKEAFLVLMVCNNNSVIDNKALKINLEAFADFSKKYSDVRLYIHTNMNGNLDIKDYLTQLGITDKVYFSDLNQLINILPRETICKFYCMADVLLQASKSEHFGLSILQSQFCHTPVITNKSTCMEEITHLGIVTTPNEIVENVESIVTWSLPDKNNIIQALMDMKNRRLLNRNNVSLNNYHSEQVSLKWIKFLDF